MTTETNDTMQDQRTSIPIPEPQALRPLGTLLELGTFQGMTDEEISSIIVYRIQQALTDESIRAQAAESAARAAAWAEERAATTQMLASMVESNKRALSSMSVIDSSAKKFVPKTVSEVVQ